MLVLSRKLGEKIDIDGGVAAGGITVTVVAIKGDKVRLGIEAPREKRVFRREINPDWPPSPDLGGEC